MNHATLDDFEKVYAYYQKYKVWFPHVRTDKLKRVIEEGRCIFKDGVVLTYNIYKRRTRVSNNSKVLFNVFTSGKAVTSGPLPKTSPGIFMYLATIHGVLSILL